MQRDGQNSVQVSELVVAIARGTQDYVWHLKSDRVPYAASGIEDEVKKREELREERTVLRIWTRDSRAESTLNIVPQILMAEVGEVFTTGSL